jgi:RecB family exonuclease
LPTAEGESIAPPLILRLGELEVRVSGRIDRVDVVDLPDGQGIGFWVIDYKLGRSGYYTASDLKEFRRLQLSLYALAVERVFLDGQGARPLGLAYWLLAENGPKVVMPGHPRYLAWLDEAKSWEQFRDTLEQQVVEIVARIRAGQFPLRPALRTCTQTCDFGRICRISQSRAVVEGKSWPLPLV